MSQRTRRSTARPNSYKAFSETGETEDNRHQKDECGSNSFNEMNNENIKNLVSLAEHLTPLTPERSNDHNGNGNGIRHQSQTDTQQVLFQDDELDIYINPGDDDLDKGRVAKNTNIPAKNVHFIPQSRVTCTFTRNPTHQNHEMVNAKNIHEALANKCKRKHRSQK